MQEKTPSVLVSNDDVVITERTGLIRIVHQPTREHNKLDRIFVSNLAYSAVRAVTSVVKSDHLAVIACSDTTKGTITKTKSQHKYRPKTATQHARFLDHISTADISFVPPNTVSGGVQTAFGWFYQVLLEHMNSFYPERVITTSSRDPAFRDVVLGTRICTRVVLEYKSRVLVLVLVLEG